MTGSKRTEFRERIDEVNERFETIMLGLRLVKGISKKSFMERFGRDIYYYYGEAIKT